VSDWPVIADTTTVIGFLVAGLYTVNRIFHFLESSDLTITIRIKSKQN
jgi:vacuolar-type H+-ATPase subunit F/Vma7